MKASQGKKEQENYKRQDITELQLADKSVLMLDETIAC